MQVMKSSFTYKMLIKYLKKVIKAIMENFESKRSRSQLGKNPKSATLTPMELEFLLNLIAKSNFEGKDVQIVYDSAVKLQTLLNTKD